MDFTVSIPRPCAESWAAMTPANGGRHCAACHKTVVDFTLKSDAEILAYFWRADVGGTCGRFRTSQIGRPLVARPTQPPRQWQPWLAGVLAAALALQACDPATRVAPRPPLAHTPRLMALDSATVLPDKLLTGDTTLASACPTDSRLIDHINLIQGFTVTPEPDPK